MQTSMSLSGLRSHLRKYKPTRAEAFDLCELAIFDRDALELCVLMLSAQMLQQFTEWQIDDIETTISPDPAWIETLLARCRGGSKSRDNTIACDILNAGEAGTVGMWLAGNTHQLSQAIRYQKTIKADTFLGKCFKIMRDPDTNGRVLLFHNGSENLFNACTATSGPRTNLLMSDEAGKITEQHKKENLMHARGMLTGAEGRKRIRWFTTLSIGTPIEQIYHDLEPLGRVIKRYPEECTWWDEQDWALYESFKRRMPRWWFNQEYRNILDAPGGKIFTDIGELIRFDPPVEVARQIRPGDIIVWSDRTGQKHDIEITKHFTARAGTDWNPSWGHTVSVHITNGTQNFIIDEFRGTSVFAMAQFLLKWQSDAFWGNRFYYCAELQGALKDTQSRAPDLMTEGVVIHEQEPWHGAMQILKLTVAEGINEHDNMLISTKCPIHLEEMSPYRRDPNTGLPADKQEDHMIDGYLHALEFEGVTVQTSAKGW